MWDLLAPEEGGSRNSDLGGVEFEPLVEIVNPISARAWSLRDSEKRVTEVEASPRTGQRPGKIVAGQISPE
jgi:hypothetical protein